MCTLIAGVLLAATAGCGNSDKTADNGANNGVSASSPAESPATHGPEGPPMAPAPTVDYTQVPNTTTVDGKVVPLKTMAGGLKYYDVKVGGGKSPQAGQTVSVQYTGTLIDGTKFDSSYDHGGQPFDFPLRAGRVIKGWDEGVPTMKIGGKRHLVIPGSLAYGPNSPTPTIPPNATLIFDIELIAAK